jgi:hypothetical protein
MTADLLMVIVLGTCALAITVDLAAVLSWLLRRR